MVVSDENNSNSTIMPRNFRGGVGQNRRTLTVINQNIRQGTPYPSVVNKRVLPEKHEICEKKHVDPVHRPTTRKFAAQIASSLQSNAEKTKKSNPLISNTNEFGDSIAIGDEHKLPADQPGPMALEPMLSDLDEMEEVEMEDIDEEEILDIDSPDANNFLAVVEYIEDLLSYYREMEYIGCVPPNYMEEQADINENMRAILVDWLIFMMHYEFDLMQETVFLTINLLDRYLSKQTVTPKKLQLVGLVAMLLACKYEEVSPPVVSDLIHISDKTYTRGEILELEKLMINTLQYNISVPTAYVFIRRFFKAAQADQKLELVAFFLLELSLVEYEMLKFPPSLLAAAAVYTAQCTVNGFRRWDKTCQWHTNYSEDQLLECSSLMVGFHQKAGTGELTGVHRKYCSSTFSFAAECEPVCFLLEKELKAGTHV